MNWLHYEVLNIEVSSDLCILERAHDGDAGLDCKSAVNISIPPNTVGTVNLGFKAEIGYGYAGFLVSRSGQSKLRVSLANRLGIIDHQYRGWIIAKIENLGDTYYDIKAGDRVAQLVIVPVALPRVNVVSRINEETVRGVGGFGSTGI